MRGAGPWSGGPYRAHGEGRATALVEIAGEGRMKSSVWEKPRSMPATRWQPELVDDAASALAAAAGFGGRPSSTWSWSSSAAAWRERLGDDFRATVERRVGERLFMGPGVSVRSAEMGETGGSVRRCTAARGGVEHDRPSRRLGSERHPHAQPGAELARVQRARPRAHDLRRHPAARTGALCRDLREAISTSSSRCGCRVCTTSSPAGITTLTPDGRSSPASNSTRSGSVVSELVQRHEHIYVKHLLPALRDAGIPLLEWDDLTERERIDVTERFDSRHPLRCLTPLAVDPGPSVPLHLGPVAQPCRDGARPDRSPPSLRPGEGPQHARAVDPPRCRGGSSRWRR